MTSDVDDWVSEALSEEDSHDEEPVEDACAEGDSVEEELVVDESDKLEDRSSVAEAL